MIQSWDEVHLSWAALALAFATAVAMLFARRLLPPTYERRGRIPIFFLFLSVVVRLVGVLIESASITKALNLTSAILLTAGMTGVVGTVLFDLVLARLRIVVPTILRDLILAIAFVAAIFSLLRNAGASLYSLLGTSAVIGAAIGLALQEPIANMFAGLSLQLDRTLGLGDWVRVGERIGRIQKISFRATTLETKDGDTVTVPNRFFMQHEVMNFSRPDPSHRMVADLSFHYRHPPNEVKSVIEAAVLGTPGVLHNPAPRLVVRAFGDHGVEYLLQYWIDDFSRDSVIESDVRTRVWYAAHRHGLEFPFPTRTIYMHQESDATRSADGERAHAERRSALARIELFAVLDEADREALARDMRLLRFARGEVLIRQGAPGDSLFLVATGEVGVYLQVEGAERQVATLHAGDILGEQSLMTGEPRAATCVALADVSCHEVGHAAFERLLAAKPKLAEDLSAILSARQTALEAEREGLSAEAAAARQAEARRRTLGRIKAFFRLG